MLTRQLARLTLALLIAACTTPTSGIAGSPGKAPPPGSIQLHGAGATFPAPLYKKSDITQRFSAAPVLGAPEIDL
jgi:ABC-type phosphate transport system substrate-binding protein